MPARLSISDVDELSTSFSEGLFIYHCGISKDNFLIDTATKRLWMIGFQHVGVLPKLFQTYAFFRTGAFAAAVGRKLGYKPSKISNKMVNASVTLKQTGGDASLSKYSSSFIGT
jgi:hypothetical protein